jgi:hypothetical protein
LSGAGAGAGARVPVAIVTAAAAAAATVAAVATAAGAFWHPGQKSDADVIGTSAPGHSGIVGGLEGRLLRLAAPVG